MTRRLRWTLLALVAAIGLLAACSDDQAAPVVPETNVDQPEVGPAVSDDSAGTTTIDPGTTQDDDDVEPTVLRETKLGRVFIAANGNDGRSGEGAGQAVASLDRALSILAPGGDRRLPARHIFTATHRWGERRCGLTGPPRSCRRRRVPR